jgi:hypothetical protein
MHDTHPLTALADDELLRRLLDLLQHSRETEADVVAHLGEVEARRLYAREASPSMFAYCTDVLHFSEAESYLRIAAARACRLYPELLAMLADGRIHLTGVAKLAPHLTSDNHLELLRLATHCSKRRIEELIAAIAPRPDAPSLVRRLPDRAAGGPLRPDGVATGGGAGVVGPAPVQRPAAVGAAAAADGHPNAAGDGTSSLVAVPATVRVITGDRQCVALPVAGRAALSLRNGSIEPLAPARYKVQFTASEELRDQIERLRVLLRPGIPDGELGAVIGRAVMELLGRLEARRYGKRRPGPVASPLRPDAVPEPRRASSGAAASSGRETTARGNELPLPQAPVAACARHVPAALRRAVHERDGGRCAFVDRSGRRCSERARLEYHHRHPFGMGGGHSLPNLALVCRAHNAYVAEHDYGREAMARYRHAFP